MIAPIASTLVGDLFVREHGAKDGAPVDGYVGEVREPVAVNDPTFLIFTEVVP